IWLDFGNTVLFVTHDIDEAIYLSDDIYVFTPRPGKIRAKITVPIDRPRSPEDMTSPQFMELKHFLLNLLYTGDAVQKKVS
ncbi:MAG: ABC transporter ATP-binding protein, partial [Ruminococcaceae bacterium]|nr:ABC transporter ATP-binding protein [Oscillospiraceae bacterium]